MNTLQNNNQKRMIKSDIFCRSLCYLGAVFMMVPFLLILFCDSPRDYEHSVGNLGLLVLCCFLFGGIFLLFRLLESKDFTKTNTKRNLLIGYLLVLLLQMYVVTNTYFITGWDVGLLKERVVAIMNGSSMYEAGAEYGYSVSPNNLLMFYITYLIMKTAVLLRFSQPYLLCIYVSCFCVTFSCFLGSLLILRFLQSRVMLVVYCFLSFVLLICSPWISIPYTDTFGMFFVMLALYLLFSIDNFYIHFAGLILTSFIGYMIKPTCIFTLFAGILVSLPELFGKELLREKLKKGSAVLAFFVAGYLVTLAIPVWIQHTFTFKLNPDLRLSYAHFLLIGSNIDSCGSWNDEDYWMGITTNGYEYRKQTELRKMKERYLSYSQSDLRRHLKNKMLFIMNDGSFAWTKEGAFFDEAVEHNHFLYPIAKDIFTPEGKYFLRYKTMAQFFWIFVLLGIPFAAFSKKVPSRSIAILFIAVCGLVTFLMLFEARARYLFLYMPVFILLSTIGYHFVLDKLSSGSLQR